MASTQQQIHLSPAELAYLHSSLSLQPPVRPDGRRASQFRPLAAETGVLPGTNGSARVCFADGTEAIVGVKAEVEKTTTSASLGKLPITSARARGKGTAEGEGKRDKKDDDNEDNNGAGNHARADDTAKLPNGNREPVVRDDWVEMTVEIPGVRDDDPATIFLASMLAEALLADGEFCQKLYINSRFHWRLYLDILLISAPLSYPLPLLSLTAHLALLSTRLPRLRSEGDEDPVFDDDWHASTPLYADDDATEANNDGASPMSGPTAHSRPPITLLLAAVGDSVVVDPTKEELAVAETALAVSVAEVRRPGGKQVKGSGGRDLRLRAVRTVDPPSRLTAPGVPSGAASTATATAPVVSGGSRTEGLWRAPVGGAKLAVLERMIAAVMEKGGAADEVLDGLEGVALE